MAVAALVSWLLAGAAGIYMFGAWLSHGGPGHQRARSDGLPPAVISPISASAPATAWPP